VKAYLSQEHCDHIACGCPLRCEPTLGVKWTWGSLGLDWREFLDFKPKRPYFSRPLREVGPRSKDKSFLIGGVSRDHRYAPHFERREIWGIQGFRITDSTINGRSTPRVKNCRNVPYVPDFGWPA
jgi:hypothetical protein